MFKMQQPLDCEKNFWIFGTNEKTAKKCSPSLPSSVNCHPNLRESCKACPSKAAWCINFLGIQPTFTHVPPRPERKEQKVFFTSLWLISKENQRLWVKLLYNRFATNKNLPHEFPRGVGVTKSSTITFFSYLAASCKTNKIRHVSKY